MTIIESYLRTLMESNVTRTVLAVLAILVTITIYLLNRKRKQLSYRIIAQSPLIEVDSMLKDRVQISLDGQPTGDISLVVINIENSGNEPIKTDDFEKPLTVNFGTDAQVISVHLTSRKPADLEPEIAHEKGEVQLTPLLLNRGDMIGIAVLVSNFSGNIVVSARIVGVNKISQSKSSNNSWSTVLASANASLALACAIGFAATRGASTHFHTSAQEAIILALAAFAGGAGVFYLATSRIRNQD